MLHAARTERDYAAAFIIAIAVSFVVNILSQFSFFPLCIHTPSSILYCFIIIGWAVTVAQRIIHPRIRRHLTAISVFLLILFIFRICRWNLFAHSAAADRYLYYLLYISFIMMPMLSLSAADYVSKDENADMSGCIRVLWGTTGILLLGVLTNDFHHFVLSFSRKPDATDQISYCWLYYVIFVWSFAVTLGSFLLLIKKCKLSQCRRKWYIPIIPAAAALILVVVYYLCGGNSDHLSAAKDEQAISDVQKLADRLNAFEE